MIESYKPATYDGTVFSTFVSKDKNELWTSAFKSTFLLFEHANTKNLEYHHLSTVINVGNATHTMKYKINSFHK